MSMSRSPATLALLRSLTKSASPQVSRLCLECLHSPASCQISSIVQATSAGHAIPSARWQSTAASSSLPTNDTHTTLMSLGTASSPSSTNPEEAATTTSDSASTSSGVASSSQAAPTPALPSLNDLEALKARNIRLPSEASPADSPEVGMYNRRFKRIAGRVSKAFNKEQLIHLAKMLKLENTTFKSGKTALVKQILTQHWGYVDPAEIVARDAERRQREESTPKDVIKEIPVTEKELFFLLSKGHTSQLLRRLSGISSKVRVSIRNSDSPELHLTGPSHLVKSIEAEWTRLRKGIKTEVLDTKLSEPLRPDLCKSISLQADAFITQKGVRSRKLEVSQRSESSVPTRRAEACLRYLAVQSATMRDSPRFGFLDSAADNIAYLPTVPENQLPWDLRALPTLAISRYTSTSPAAGPIKLYRANNQPEEATTQDLRSALFDPLGNVPGTLQFNASFGNLLRVMPSASLEHLDEIMQSDWAGRPDTVFLPATYTGFANRYSVPLRRVESRHIEEHARNLSVTTQYIRRLIYVSNDISTPLGILKFERELASPKEAAQSSRVDEEDQLKAWSVYEGRRNTVHISMPHSINDVRLEATKMESGSEDLTAPLANVTRNAAPMTITVGENTYHLLEDNMIRSTKFVSGIPEPLASYKDTIEPVLERRTNMLHKQRSMALELHGSSPAQALESVTHMLQHL